MPGVDVSIGIDATAAESGARRVTRSFNEVGKASGVLNAQQQQTNENLAEMERMSQTAASGVGNLGSAMDRAGGSTLGFIGRIGAMVTASLVLIDMLVEVGSAFLRFTSGAVKAAIEAEGATSSVARSIENLRTEAQELRVEYGSAFIPAVESSAMVMSDLLAVLRPVVEEIRKLGESEEARRLLSDITTIAAELTPLLAAIVSIGVAAEFQKFKVALEGIAILLEASTTPLRIIANVAERIGIGGPGKSASEDEARNRERSAAAAEREAAAFEIAAQLANQDFARKMAEDVERLEQRLRELNEVGEARQQGMAKIRKEYEETKKSSVDLANQMDMHRAIVMDITQDAQDAADAQREMAEASKQFNDAIEESKAQALADALDELFPEEAELRRIQELRDAIAGLEITDPEKFEEANRRIDAMVDSTGEWVEKLEEVADLIDLAFGGLDSELGEAARQIVRLIDQVTRLARAWDDLSTAQRAAGVVGIASQAVDLLGLGGEGEKAGAFGGSGGGDYADVGAQVGAVIGAVIGAAIAAYFTGGLGASEGAVIGAAIGGLIGEVIGGFINRGADEGLAQLELVAGEIRTKVTKDEGGLGKAVSAIGDAVIENIDRITEILQVSVEGLPTVDIKVRGENIVAKVGEYRKVFKEIDEAIEFLTVETLRAAEFSGGIDAALTQVLQAGRFADIEGLAEQLNLIDQLIVTEKIFVQGLSEIEVQLDALPRKMALLRSQLESMGLSADNVARLAGAATVQAFAQARQAITGEELSVEQRRKIQQAQAELFNAQIQLEIARLEAEREALIAQQQLGIGEIEFERARLDARKKFLQAESQVFNAEIGLQKGFVQASAAIVNAGASTLQKQIDAISKVIEALKKIGLIDIGSLRLPGVPKIRVPRIRGGDIGGAPTGPTLADQLASLLDRLFPEASRAREYRENLDLLKRAFDAGLIPVDRYRQAVAKLGEQFTENLRAALKQIDEFGRSLEFREDSPLSPGRRLLLAQQEVARQARIARETGDVSGFISASDRLLDIARDIFGSTAGFQGIFREIQKQQHLLERDIGVQIKEKMVPPAEQTAENTAQVVAQSTRVAENTRRQVEETQELRRETRRINEDNQVGHGRTQFTLRKQSEEIREVLREQTRELKRALERTVA